MAASADSPISRSSNPTLQLAYYQALELAQFKGGFLARASHELRSPLNRIISLQQMILEGLCDNPEEERTFIEDAHAASLKLLEYLDFLIHISKVEVGRSQPTLQSVPLGSIFNQVYELTHLQAANRNLRLVVEPPDDTMHVYGDPGWIQTVLTTLIDMAIDDGDRGTLRLALAPDAAPKTCAIWVEDDRPASHWQESVSLPEPKAFELDNTLSNSVRMGLVEAMVAAMDGTVSLLSSPAAGAPLVTRVQCTLPTAAVSN